jgi:fucose 4-O-acetylase-like acetyltransferase
MIETKKLRVLKQLTEKAFFLSYLSGTRYKWVDYLKGIAVLLVVYRHVLIGIERTGLTVPSALEQANMIFYSFRMPLFFILSGLFIAVSFEKRGFKQLIKIKTETLLLPYLIWVFIQVTLQIVFSSYTNSSRTIIDYTYIFYQPRNLDQFWYLPALFNVTIIYLLLKRFLSFTPFLHLFAGIIFYFTSIFFNSISMISDWMEFYLFFALGDLIKDFLLKKQYEKKFSSPLLLAATLPFFIVAQLYYLKQTEIYFLTTWSGKLQFIFISLLGCFTMFLTAQLLQRINLLSFLRIIGYHSLYIYVMHVLVSAPVRIFLMKVLHVHQPLVLLMSGIFISIIMCIAFYNFFIKNNRLWFLFPGDKLSGTVPSKLKL